MSVSIPVSNLESEDSSLKKMQKLASTSYRSEPETSISLVQCDAIGENQDTNFLYDSYEFLYDDLYNDELYEEQYFDQTESVTKARSKNRVPNKWCNETNENFITYRKTCSKDQKERHSNKQYKLDTVTILLVEKLIDIRNLGAYHDVIAEDRNSIIIVAGEATRCWPSRTFKTAVKIYKLSDNEETNKAIFQRTQKEYEKIQGVYYYYRPALICYCKNIIVMEYLGTDDQPALSITMVCPNLLSEMYNTIIRYLTGIYARGRGVVHGHLNSKTIFLRNETVVFVGWSHSLDGNHPNALKKLMKDCYFITKFFKRRGVPVKAIEQIFKEITKLKEISADVLDVIQVLDGRKQSTYQNHLTNDDQKLRGNSRFK